MIKHWKEKLNFICYFLDISSDFLRLSSSMTNFSKENIEFIELLYNTIKYHIVSETSTQFKPFFYDSENNTPVNFYEKNILKSEKKKGAYYTPKKISNYICLETIGKKFDEIIEKFTIKCKKKNQTEILAAIHEFISIKILDPACGGGIFLTEVLNILKNKYKRILHIIKNGIEEKTLREICLKNINQLTYFGQIDSEINIPIQLNLINHIYGMDSDQYAIKIAKISIWLNLFIQIAKSIKNNISMVLQQITKSVFIQLDKNLKNGDTLKDKEFLKPEFDIIVGNPPYISSKVIDPDYKQYLKANYHTAVKQFDLYSIFLEKSFNLLKNEGYFGFIIPESFLDRSTFEVGRRLLLKNTKILKIDKIKGVFSDPSIANVIIIYKKKNG